MLSLEVKISETGAETLDDNRFMGTVKFTGQVVGIVTIQISDDFVRIMTASTQGVDPEKVEGDEKIKDLLAELSNTVGGKLKSTYTDTGLYCELATPSITTGSDFTMQSLNMDKYKKLIFFCQEHPIIVEAVVKQGKADSDLKASVEVGIKTFDILQPEPVTEKDIHYSVGDGDAKEAAKTAKRLKPKDATADKNPVKEAGQLKKTDGIVNLDVILDIPLEITVELGRTKIPIHELLEIGPGSAVSLSTLEGESVDILANNTLIAKGVVLVKNEKYGIRITKITSSMDRIKSLI